MTMTARRIFLSLAYAAAAAAAAVVIVGSSLTTTTLAFAPPMSIIICRHRYAVQSKEQCGGGTMLVVMSNDDDNNDKTTLFTQMNNDNKNIDSSIEVVNTPHITHTTPRTLPLNTYTRTPYHCRRCCPRYHPYALTLTRNSPLPTDKLRTGLRMDTAKRVTVTEPHFVRQFTNVCGNHCAW